MIRRLEENDFTEHLSLLSELTTVGLISKEKWIERFREIQTKSEIWIIHDKEMIGTATLMVEPKFIHECGSVGHIEDVVISKKINGNGFGKKIVLFLIERAKELGCYKVILDCNEINVGFYEKCGFVKNGIQMKKLI